MLTILDIQDDTPRSIAIKFILNKKFRKKGSELIASLSSALFTNNMSIDVNIDSEWVRAVTLQLEKQYPGQKIAYFIIRYQPGNIQLAAGYRDKLGA